MSRTVEVTVLGFDYGTRHIGVAVGQTVTGTASALETVGLRRGKPDWARMAALIEQWQPTRLVVGEPLNMDGTKQSMTLAARAFSRSLHGRFVLPVDLVDERLSTHAARALMAERGQRGDDHSLAAQLILETWLNEYTTGAVT